MITSLRHTFGIGLLLLAGVAQAAPVTFNLSATTGSTTLPDGVTTPILGYATTPATTVAAPGGPVLEVTVGDEVTVNLTNLLTERTALHFPGQAMVPDGAGVPTSATKAYTFTATSPGTFLYEAGVTPGSAQQVARGLHGMLVVRPATAGQAYDGASSAFGTEAILVLSELDPLLNGSTKPAEFDMRGFKPRYQLINGKAFPATARIPTLPNSRVLLRLVNAGQQQHSMTVLGIRQTLVGKDGNELTHPGTRVAETISPGETLDAICTVPADTTPGSKFAVFDGTLKLVNGTGTGTAAGFGGMLTFIEAGTPGVPGPDTVGPVAQNVAVGPIVAGSVTLSAIVSDAATGGSNVTAAEYYVDGGATGTAMSGSFGAVQATVSATLAVGALSSGNHTLYVRGQDSLGNWGARSSVVLAIDTIGPTTSGLVLSPAATRGTTPVTLTGTGSDQASGGRNVTAAEYFIDAQGANGAGALVTVSPGTSPVANLTATIPSARLLALQDGPHLVLVHSRDSAGNWGPFASVDLVVDKTVGPAVSNLAANPAASNGVTGFNSSIAAVRVTATATDALSNVVAVEGFIDNPAGVPGTGFVFVVSDGQWNGKTENAYGDIPLSTVNALTSDSHTIYVHARDAAGNWGATGTTTLLVDKVAPTLTGISLSPTTAIVGEAVTLTPVGASDAASGIAGGQYWFDTATPPAFPSSFSGTTATISSTTGGVRTVYARVRDGAGNLSPVRSATLIVPSAVNDTRTINAGGAATQTSNQSAPGLLANDLPSGMAGRTVALASAPVRLTGTGAGTVTLACPAGLGSAGPSIGGSTICTNGAYQVVLHGVGGSNNARAASKRGTFRFTYTETLNSKTTPAATVTITVN